MIATKEELRAASAAFVASYLAERGATAAEEGRADSGDKAGWGARKAPLPLLPPPLPAASHPRPLEADGRAQHPPRRTAHFLSSPAPQQPQQGSDHSATSEAAPQPPPPAGPLPPLTIPAPPADGGSTALGGQPPRVPLPAEVAAAFQAVVDRHARNTEAAGGGSKGRGGALRAVAVAATCGLYGRGGGDEASEGKGRMDSSPTAAQAVSARRRFTRERRAGHHRPGWFTQFR
jgi:hypothetical protein